MNSDDVSPHFSAVLNRINHKKANYCAVCDVSTGDSKSFRSHVAGRKHQLQLKRIENAGFDKWAKKEAKKVRRKVLRTVVSEQSEKSAKKRRKSGFVELSRPTRVLKELTPEEKPGSSKGGNSGSDTKELKRETQNRELHSVDNSELVGTIHSKISTEGCNCLSLEKVPVVQQRDINQVGGSFSVSSPSSCSTKMHPGENFNLPRYYNAKTAFPRFDASRPPPNLNNFMMDLRRQQYRYYPPHPLNYRGGYQHHRGYPPRNIPPFRFPGAPPYQQKYPPYQQGSNAGNVHLQNSKDVRRGEAWNEVIGELHSSFSGSGEMPRAEMHKGTDSQSYGSKFQTNFNHRSNVSHSRRYESVKSVEVRSPKDVRSENSHPAEHTKVKQSKTVASTKQYAKANESLPKKPPELKLVDCPKARLRASRSGDPAASSARSPTLSNVVMQRMNARLQSFTKYGKMPTSGQIRHLALSGTSPVQENADGKLREWSKKINESHHNLSAEDKELINRLVNFPCSRSEQKKLEYCIREHARSRKKLTLPRFNLQLSAVEACKGSPSVDDNVSSMVTEVVDCLPEDVLNSLINALNSDIDENVTVDFPFGIDSHLAAQSEEVNGVCGPSHLDHTLIDEDSCRIIGEVRSNSSYEKKPEYPEQGHHGSVHSTLCHTKENSQHTSSLKDIQVGEHNSTVSDHNCPVVATEQLALGSSLEISESRIPSDKQNLSADPQEEASVEITIKKEPSDPQDGKSSSAAVESSDPGRNVDFVVTSRSENAKKIYYKSIRVHIKNEIPDDHHSVDTTSGASSYPSTLSSSPHKSSVSSPVSTVLKDPSRQTAPVSSEKKKRKLGRPVQNDNHSKKPVELRDPTEIKEERVEEPSDSVVSEVAMEGMKAAESGSRTFAIGVSLLPSYVTPRNRHAVEDNHVKENEDFENAVNGYPGLSWISKPQYEPADTVTSLSLSTGTLCTLTALPQNSHIQGVTPFCGTANQEFENHANSASDDVGFKVIKVESTDDFKSKESSHMQLDQPPLPKISSVTSIRNCEDIPGDPPPDMCNTSVQIKQEPFSSTPEETNRCDQNSVSIESKKQVNCSKSTLTQSTDSTSSAPLAKSPALSTESHGIAASFPGVIQKVKYSSQREDLEKIPEVSSSTGAVLLDEVQPAAVPIRKDSKSRSLDLIHELLEITASEEKLVERAREAERTISQLTASLEEWKHKKYEIEQEQMKLRMKRQELLLTAAKDSVPCDKRDLQSVPAATSVSSGEEKQSTPSMRNISSLSNEKSDSESESDSSWSQSLSRTRHTRSSSQKRKERRSPHTSSAHAKQKLRPRFKRELSNEPLSDSSASISDGSSKHRIHTRSSRDDGCSSSVDRISSKRIRLGIREAQVVLKPLELNRNREKIVVNDDDVVVLKETPRCSTESREEVELSSSDEEMETVQSGEGSESCQENVITPSTEPTSSPEFVVNIGVLSAHSTAIVDLKVYDGYLYSCSLDCTAKRFSIKDPKNDSTSYEGHTLTVTSICLSPSKEEVYTTCNDKYLRCFAPDTGVNIKNYEMNYPISCSCEGGGTLYFGLTSGEVIFFSFRLKREVYRLENSSSCPIGRIATVTQGAQRLLCVAANDGIVSLYDTATGLLLRCLEGRVQPPCCIKICDNSVYITTSDKSIVLHDLLSGKLEKMMNWPASATGLELMDDFILTSSYDGLIRCHKKNQKELSLHSLYYGAGKAMVMSMTSYKEWVFTGNRKGLIEAFKFDPSERFSCEYGRCRQNYGRDCDVMHHIESDHLPSVNNKTKTCPWRTCTHYFTPRTTLEEKQNHVKDHLSGICPQAL